MSSIELIKMAFSNLLKRKARTILTTIGVIIGTTSIIVMLSMGIGMDQSMESMFSEHGNLKSIEVSGANAESSKKPTYLDDELIAKLEKIDNVDVVVGKKRFDGRLLTGRYEGYAEVIGIDFSKAEKLGIKLVKGSYNDLNQKHAAIIGGAVRFVDPRSRDYREINVDYDKAKVQIAPMGGSSQRPKGFQLNIVGVTDENDFSNSYSVYVNYEEYSKFYQKFAKQNKIEISKEDKKRKYNSITVIVTDRKYTVDVQNQIKGMNLEAYSMGEMIEQAKSQMKVIQYFLAGIGAVALFVAAIGITNTMVMSIYERRKEIGIMKVIGAQVKDIRNLFLCEAGLIGLFGGIIGILISLGVAGLMGTAMQGSEVGELFKPVIPTWLIGFGVLFSIFIAVLSGLYPAIRATKLSALEAIRTE